MPLSPGLSFAATANCSQRLAPRAAISGTTTDVPAAFGSPESPTKAPRGDVERTMRHDDSAIQQALIVLGQAINPIRVVSPEEIREIYARAGIGEPPAGLHAFRAQRDMSDPNIYVNKNSPVYRNAARKPSALSVLKLAAMLAHEQLHNTDGEFAAYRVQSDFFRSKLNGMPWRQREAARQHLQELDARARSLARAEQRRSGAWGARDLLEDCVHPS